MRKRSENRVYTDENIRDSIVMGELSSKFPDFGTLYRFGVTVKGQQMCKDKRPRQEEGLMASWVAAYHC